MQLFQDITINMIYVMGFSFILGSLCTILMLLLLDAFRQYQENDQDKL